MKRKLLQILPLLLLGGFLGIPALSHAPFSHVKATDEKVTGYVDLGATEVEGWSATAHDYCGGYYGSKTKEATISNSSISDFSVLATGSHELKVWVTGFTNSGNNKVIVSTLNSFGNVVTTGVGQTGKLGSGSNLSSATKKETDAFTFTALSNVTGLQVELGTKCVATKIRWEIKATEGGGGGGQEDNPPVVEGTEYSLVTDSSTLSVGDTIILGCSAQNKVSGAFNTKYLSAVTASFSENKFYTSNAAEIVLGGEPGAWKLLLGSDQIIAGDSGSISLGSEGTEWDISITDNVAKISNGSGSIQFNSANPRFTYYTSAQGSIEIYKKAGETVSYTVNYDGNGHSGSVVDSNSPYSAASNVTILANGFDSVTGQVFKEWNTQADGKGTSYAPGASLTITSNLTLYAIWEEEYIPVGDTFTKVTSTSALNDGDKFLFVFHNGQTVKVNGGLESSDHFAAYDATIVDDELSYTSEAVKPLTLVKEGAEYYIELNGSYLALTSNSTNKLAWKTKANANKWTITFGASGNAVVSSSISGVTHSIYYNGSGTGRFSNYSSSTMSPIELWAKSGHAKEVSLDKTSIDLNVEQTATLKVEECIGFTPSSYAWEITSGTEYVEITAGQGTNEITLTGLAEGEAEVYVTVDGVKAKATVNVHDYKYNILDKSSYFITVSGAMMKNDLSYVTDVDFDETNMWSFEKAYAGDNSYYLSSSEGYLSFSEDVVADGKNISEIEITTNPVNVWTVTYSDGNGYKVATNTKTQGVRSLATHEETWYAFTGNNYVNLVEAGEFDRIDVKSLPTTKQYFVGDDLKPLNAHVYAVYTNGFEVEITNKIVWDKLVEGTKATGKVTIGGQERDVQLDGIEVYKGDASTFVVEGLEDNYAAGEKINKELLTVSITYKLAGKDDITKTLTKDDFVISPERIEEETTKVRISLAKDPTVYYEKEIEVKESPYVATNYVGVGDEVVIGTLGYDPYEITGGVELVYEDNKFANSNFGSLPRGETVFEVGKEGGYYTLKDTNTGYYLKGDNSSLGFNLPDTKSVYAEGDGHYEFNMSVSIGGSSYIVTMHTTKSPDFSFSNVFSSMDYLPDSYTDYIVGISDLENNKLYFSTYIGGIYSENAAEVNLASWSFNNGVFQYALETSTKLPDECLFTLAYDDDYEEWAISSKPHTDKQLYFNKDGQGKFGFYTSGSSYTPIMLFRNNDKPLQSTVQSLSVSFREGMDVVSVGDNFPWTSALIVKANYSGGASSIIPVGGYEITQMPDTSVIGKATGTISYGQNGHKITKDFTITVKGNTQAFDVVCKDPILVGETYQAHLDNYEVPEDEPLTWSVSDPTLASIDQDGNVTGLAPGYVDVIATSYDGTYSDSEHIRIYQQVESVSLNKTSLELNAGEKAQLTATVLPENASNKNVSYSSSDPLVAFVDEKTGQVTGVKPGTATITCAAQNHPEENFATCVVTVKEAPIVHVTSITLNCTTQEVAEGETFKLNATVSPSNATVKEVLWTSNHTNIATVDQDGVVKGVKNGTCVITATTADGGLTASCTVTVKKTSSVVHVNSVKLSATSLTLDVNETETLSAEVKPYNATDKNVSWTSSDTSVATVLNGVVTAVGEGNATITVTTADGGYTATCLVTVTHNEPTPTPTPTPEEPQEEKEEEKLAPAAIAGIAVGSTAAAGGIGYGVFAVLKKTGKIKIRKHK